MKFNILNVCIVLALVSARTTLAGTSVGDIELKAVESVLTGNIGMAVGLIITIWGIWELFVKGETVRGGILLFCGVAITVFPGVFNVFQALVLPAVQVLTGG